jgi:hypothetical protein
MLFHTERLIYVVPALFVFCFLLDQFIWWLNHRWLRRHPGNPRHPYSPLFTAIGVTGVTGALALLVPWQYAAVSYALYIVYGGLMWLLHSRRWMFRA